MISLRNSLALRLTIAYSISILCIIVLFTIGSSVLMRGLSLELHAQT